MSRGCRVFTCVVCRALQALVNVQLLGKYPPFKQLLDIQFTNAILVSILPGVCSVNNASCLASEAMFQLLTSHLHLPVHLTAMACPRWRRLPLQVLC